MGRFLSIARNLNWPRIASVAVILMLAFVFWGTIFATLTRAVTHH